VTTEITDEGQSDSLNRVGLAVDAILRLLAKKSQRPPGATLDFQGYNFWLNKLTQFNGDYNGAEMVKAFLVSTEYRQRFDP